MIRVVKSLVLTITAAIAGMLVVFGELDDSPGLGGIGLIIIGLSFYLNLKSRK